jgi:GntR family transcriptional regulator/MocR family aminotransferase
VIGYGSTSAEQLALAVRVLAELVRKMTGESSGESENGAASGSISVPASGYATRRAV